MKQDEHSIVREAQNHARHDLRHHGRVRPAVFMLVQHNPQTGAPMAQPAAIGTVVEDPMNADDRHAWFDGIREEAARLGAIAVAICMDAEAEVEAGQTVHMAVISVEDREGTEVLVAPVDHGGVGVRVAEFGLLDVPNPAEAVGIPPLLPAR